MISLISTDAVCSMCYREGGGGGTPLYKPYRYVPHQWVKFLRRFGLKTVKDFAHLTGIGYSFRGSYTVVYEHICQLVLND